MAARTFEDSKGATWEVFEVHRASKNPGAVSAGLEKGWLAFVNSEQKRRLAPFPADWEVVGDSELERLCGQARLAGSTPVSRSAALQDAAAVAARLARALPTLSRDDDVRPRVGRGPEVLPSGDDVPRLGDAASVEEVVRTFAHEARTTGLPAIGAMVRLKSLLAERFPGEHHVARDLRRVRRWFVEAYYFERDA